MVRRPEADIVLATSFRVSVQHEITPPSAPTNRPRVSNYSPLSHVGAHFEVRDTVADDHSLSHRIQEHRHSEPNDHWDGVRSPHPTRDGFVFYDPD